MTTHNLRDCTWGKGRYPYCDACRTIRCAACAHVDHLSERYGRDTYTPGRLKCERHAPQDVTVYDAQGERCTNPAHVTASGEHVNYYGAVYCATHGTPMTLQLEYPRSWRGARCLHCTAPVCEECDQSPRVLSCGYCETAYTPNNRRNKDGAVCAVCDHSVSGAYGDWRADSAESCRACGAPVCNDCAPVNGQPCGYCGVSWPLDRVSWPYDHAPGFPCMAAPVLQQIEGESDMYTSTDGAVWRYCWDMDIAPCSHCGARCTALYCCLDDGSEARCSACVSVKTPDGEFTREQWDTPYTAPSTAVTDSPDAECYHCRAPIYSGESARPDEPICSDCDRRLLALERFNARHAASVKKEEAARGMCAVPGCDYQVWQDGEHFRNGRECPVCRMAVCDLPASGLTCRYCDSSLDTVPSVQASAVTFTETEARALAALKRRASVDPVTIGYVLALLDRGAIAPEGSPVDTSSKRAALAAL